MGETQEEYAPSERGRVGVAAAVLGYVDDGPCMANEPLIIKVLIDRATAPESESAAGW